MMLASCVLVAGCSLTQDSPDGTATSGVGGSGQTVGVTTFPPTDRQTLPDISGQTLDGQQLSLSSFAGHVVVLNVWASWCTPCRQESPELARVARSSQAQGVRFVGLDEQDRASAARSFVAEAGVSYPQLIDQTGSVLASLRLVPANGIPSTLVLARDGRVAARVIGPVTAATLRTLLAPLLGRD